MFCQTCGNSIIEGLSYCNRCGARMTMAIEKVETPKESKHLVLTIMTLSIVMMGIMLGGFALMLPLIFGLLEAGVKHGPIVVIAFACLGTVFGISFLMIRQISRALDAYLHGGDLRQKQISYQQPTQQPAQLFERNTGQIEAPREPFISVTEHTTRILDHVQQERNS